MLLSNAILNVIREHLVKLNGQKLIILEITNYFLNFENRHYTNKIIAKLIKVENQEEIVNHKAILNEIEHF